MVGRKPKPTALKLLAGNPGRRPLSDREPRPEAAIPRCPKHLGDEARREWRRVAKQLYALGVLTEIDRGELAAYCVAWGRWVEAEEKVRAVGTVIKSPKGYPLQNPYLAIANRALEQMHTLAVEFGMTPSSRSRVKIARPSHDEKEEAAKRFFA